MAVHEGIKLKCSECDYECNMKKQMSKHTNTVHSDIEYKCKLCEFTTKDKWNLKKHDKNVHEQLRRECPICGISVAYNTSMQRHIRQVHGGEKPKTKHSDLSCKETNCCVEDEQNKTQWDGTVYFSSIYILNIVLGEIKDNCFMINNLALPILPKF